MIIKLVKPWQAATKVHVLSIQRGKENYQDLYNIESMDLETLGKRECWEEVSCYLVVNARLYLYV